MAKKPNKAKATKKPAKPAKKTAPKKASKPAKKAAKKTNSPAKGKKVVAKKPAPKKAAPKKIVKAASKKPAPKKVVSKKLVSKKATPSKAKAVKKPVAKAKPVAKKVVAKSVAKKVAPSKKPAPAKAALKPVAKPEVKRPVAAIAPVISKPMPVAKAKLVAKKREESSSIDDDDNDNKSIIPQKEEALYDLRPVMKRYDANQPKPQINKDKRTRYSDKELQEFKQLILEKIGEAKKDYELLKSTLSHRDDHGTDDTSPTFKLLEDGSDVLSKEETAQLASRQEKFIQNLQNALIRIENKTYGICRVTGKLISKERLRSVPHATLGIDAKLGQIA